MQYLIAILVLVFLVGYVIPNIIRYPWHTLVFVVVGVGLTAALGGGEKLMARLRASGHPAARRYLAVHGTLFDIFEGVPPYNRGRWWLVRTLVQLVLGGVLLAAALAVLVAMGAAFNWLDRA